MLEILKTIRKRKTEVYQKLPKKIVKYFVLGRVGKYKSFFIY